MAERLPSGGVHRNVQWGGEVGEPKESVGVVSVDGRDCFGGIDWDWGLCRGWPVAPHGDVLDGGVEWWHRGIAVSDTLAFEVEPEAERVDVERSISCEIDLVIAQKIAG